ncbi:MAG: tetratricopeptide repeat protein [Planctomycetota bacterium]
MKRRPTPRLLTRASIVGWIALSIVACSDADPVTVPRPGPGVIPEAALSARLDTLADAVEAEPDRPEAWAAYAELLYDCKLWKIAIESLDAAAPHQSEAEAWRLRYLAAVAESQIDPEASVARLRTLIGEDARYVPAQVRLGLQLAGSFDPEEGLAVLEGARASEPRSLDVLSAIGMVLTDMQRFEEALPLLTEVLEQDPGRYEAHAPLARCLFATGRDEDAALHVDAAGRQSSSFTSAVPRDDPRALVTVEAYGPRARVEEGERLVNEGRIEEAIAAFREVAETTPHHHSAWLSWAKALAAVESYEEAIDILERGIAASPGASELHDQLAGVHMMRQDWEAARQPLQRATELRPGAANLWAHRAQLATSRGDPTAALAYVEKALARDRNLAAGWLERARAEVALGRDLADVRASLEGAARCTSIPTTDLLRLATALVEVPGGLQLVDEVARTCAQKLDKPFPFARWLGRVALSKGLGEPAHAWLLRALAGEPDDARLRQETARAMALDAAALLGSDFERARLYLERSTELDAEWFFPQRLLAWSLATDERDRDGARALVIAEQALALPDAASDPLTHDALAAALAANGRFEEAANLLTTVLDRLPPNLKARLAPMLHSRLERYQNETVFTLDPRTPLPEQL